MGTASTALCLLFPWAGSFLVCGWSVTVTGRWGNLHPWRLVNLGWMRPWAAWYSSEPSLKWEVEPRDLQRSFLTWIVFFSFIRRWELCKVSKIISCFWLDTSIAVYVSKLQRLLVSLDTACLPVTEHFGLSEVITVLKAGEDVTSANSTAWCQHKTPTATREAPLKKAARVDAV